MSVFDAFPFDRLYSPFGNCLWDWGNLGATKARMILSARPVSSNIPSRVLPATY